MTSTLQDRLTDLAAYAREHMRPLEGAMPPATLILSVSDGPARAVTRHAAGKDFAEVWKGVSRAILSLIRKRNMSGEHLRLDWITAATPLAWEAAQAEIAAVKRGYYRFGLAFGAEFSQVLTEMECHANAIFFGDAPPNGAFTPQNFERCAGRRFTAKTILPRSPGAPVWRIETEGVYCGPDGALHPLPGLSSASDNVVVRGMHTGHRVLPRLSPAYLRGILDKGTRWLCAQVHDDGKFTYGVMPCFDRPIPSYNTMRHASSLYSILDTMPFIGGEDLLPVVERGLRHVAERFILETRGPDGREMAFLVEEAQKELKLGGSGVTLLAFAKYKQLTGAAEYDRLMRLLGEGIAYLQQDSGAFIHVLHSDSLEVKDIERTVYYDGEAVFGLMRLYALDRDERWLALARKSFDYFVTSKSHLAAHDHWLSYAVNELCLHAPEERYFRFGFRNCAEHLNFIQNRETTYPTLLELVMAAQQLVLQAEKAGLAHVLAEELDMERFSRAMHHRARYLLHGFFWPEMAMFFARPESVEGAFFIRHQGFRTRIDDVQHYLSGLAAYGAMLERGEPRWAAPEAEEGA